MKRTYTYQIVRPYSYWTIDNLEVYGIKEAMLRNYALPNETITLRPQSYTPPSYIAATQGNFIRPLHPGQWMAVAVAKTVAAASRVYLMTVVH